MDWRFCRTWYEHDNGYLEKQGFSNLNMNTHGYINNVFAKKGSRMKIAFQIIDCRDIYYYRPGIQVKRD